MIIQVNGGYWPDRLYWSLWDVEERIVIMIETLIVHCKWLIVDQSFFNRHYTNLTVWGFELLG